MLKGAACESCSFILKKHSSIYGMSIIASMLRSKRIGICDKERLIIYEEKKIVLQIETNPFLKNIGVLSMEILK